MITNMIVLLCLSALFPVLMGSDCSDVYAYGHGSSGVYSLTGIHGRVWAYCEMRSGRLNDQGHWMVILKRMNGEVNFLRRWESYKWGFGNTNGEYWLGLEFLHELTRRYQYNLRVDVEDFAGNKAYALYKSFSVSSEDHGYKLHVSGFVNGGAGDCLTYHNGMKFTTYDKDQDNSGSNCAKDKQGGFWYNDCFYTTPTGQYLGNKQGDATNLGVTWYYWKNSWSPLKSITMKIRRVRVYRA